MFRLNGFYEFENAKDALLHVSGIISHFTFTRNPIFHSDYTITKKNINCEQNPVVALFLLKL